MFDAATRLDRGTEDCENLKEDITLRLHRIQIMSIIVKALLISIGSKLSVGELAVECEFAVACLSYVSAVRGFEVRAGLHCGVDANSLVLAFVADAGAGAQLRAHPLLVRHAVDGSHRDVVEGDGLLVDVRVVESAPVEARLLEAERVPELFIVDWLLLQKVGGCLEDDERRLVVLETLDDGTYEKVCARVNELDCARGVQSVGYAADGLLVTTVVSGAQRRVAGAVGDEDHDVRA